jgi:prepilin-type N-terminal cleavage/methylation domain-containing protein
VKRVKRFFESTGKREHSGERRETPPRRFQKSAASDKGLKNFQSELRKNRRPDGRRRRLNRSCCPATRCSERDAPCGFTLIEIVLVVLIIGLVTSLVMPRINAFTGGDLRGTTRHLAGTFRYLTEESATTKKRFRLYYDLKEGTYWIETQNDEGEFVQDGGKKFLPQGVSFEDVVTLQQGKITSGESFTDFFPLGVENTILHLRDRGGHVFSLIVNPLTGRMRVVDRYVDIDERVGGT